MKTIIKKRTYSSPQLLCVKLDNEISLILVSSGGDPGNPEGEPITDGKFIAPEYFNNNPFNSNFS